MGVDRMSDPANASSDDLKHWQRRVFWSVWITYFAFYLCRYNMPVAKSIMCEEYPWTTTDFGWVFSALTATYEIGRAHV